MDLNFYIQEFPLAGVALIVVAFLVAVTACRFSPAIARVFRKITFPLWKTGAVVAGLMALGGVAWAVWQVR